MAERTLRVCALYPDLMNIYADRGNLLLLERRCAWRGIGFERGRGGPGRGHRPRRARPLLHRRRARTATRRCARRTWSTTKRDALHAAADARRGRARACAAATSCSATPTSSATSEHPRRRARRPAHGARGRPAADRQRRDRGRPARARRPARAGGLREPRRAHVPRRRRAAARPRAARATATPAPRGSRACCRGNVIGTYLHGPLLPKNAWFADWLIATALGLDEPLAPLDDALEDAAHADARRAGGRLRPRRSVASSGHARPSGLPRGPPP